MSSARAAGVGRASGRAAQTAATQGRPVWVCQSSATSCQVQGPVVRSSSARVLEGKQGGVADEQGGVGVGEHGGKVGGVLEELGRGVEEVAEEHLGVGDRRAGGGVRGDRADLGEREGGFDDELDRSHAVQAGDGAAGHDAELGGEGGDGDEAEVGTVLEEVARALGGGGEVDVVALGEGGGEGWVVEVPHEGRGVEEIDGRDA